MNHDPRRQLTVYSLALRAAWRGGGGRLDVYPEVTPLFWVDINSEAADCMDLSTQPTLYSRSIGQG